MRQMHSVLIFPCGSENALELYDSLRYSPHFNVYGATSIPDRSSLIYPSSRLLTLPFINDDNFISELNKAIDQHSINMIFASHDTVLLELVGRRPEIDTKIIGCDLQTAELCRYKDRLYEFFAGEDFIPHWTTSDISVDGTWFIKPIVGQGGQGCHKAEPGERHVGKGYMASEYLPGAEYTVDCFTDRHGKLLFAGQRSRNEVRMGITFRSIPAHLPEISDIARLLNERLKFRGLWFFQVKKDKNDKPKLLEVSSRIATTMGLYRQLGINLPLMTAYDALNDDVSVLRQPFSIRLERRLGNLYEIDISYSTILVDYDDTLIIHDKVNGELISFLYQCIDAGKKIVLLTRHEGDLHTELAIRRICENMFDQIIHIPPSASKAECVSPYAKEAIYIDNMFHDRLEVARLGIPVFDVDAVPALISSNQSREWH